MEGRNAGFPAWLLGETCLERLKRFISCSQALLLCNVSIGFIADLYV